MNTSIYDKTAKGREEIATRRYQLAPRLRTLLVLVDGHKAEEELLRNVAGLGLTVNAVRDLLAQEFIVLATSYAALPEPAPAPKPKPEPKLEPKPEPKPVAVPAVETTSLPAASLPTASQVQQFQLIYDFYNKTIKSTMGLRGFTLQLRVEKAGTVDDLRELRDPYLEAVQKAKGRDAALQLAQQLDSLLGAA
jgi:hypothetical protein